MKTRRLCRAAGMLIGLGVVFAMPISSLSQAAASPQAVNAASKASAPPADAAIAAAQDHLRLVEVGIRSGINTPADVCEATIALANARIRAATDQNRFTGIEVDLATIAAQRQALLALAERSAQAGIVSPSAVSQAQAALAEVRARAALLDVVTARAAILAQADARYRIGAISSQEKDSAAAALQEAQRLFLRIGEEK